MGGVECVPYSAHGGRLYRGVPPLSGAKRTAESQIIRRQQRQRRDVRHAQAACQSDQDAVSPRIHHERRDGDIRQSRTQAGSFLVRGIEHDAGHAGRHQSGHVLGVWRGLGKAYCDDSPTVSRRRRQRAKRRRRRAAREETDFDERNPTVGERAHPLDDQLGGAPAIADGGTHRDHPRQLGGDLPRHRERHRAQRTCGRLLQIDPLRTAAQCQPRLRHVAHAGQQGCHEARSRAP